MILNWTTTDPEDNSFSTVMLGGKDPHTLNETPLYFERTITDPPNCVPVASPNIL